MLRQYSNRQAKGITHTTRVGIECLKAAPQINNRKMVMCDLFLELRATDRFACLKKSFFKALNHIFGAKNIVSYL